MSDRWPELAEIEERLAAERQQAINAAHSIQSECPHDKVVADGDWNARRICTQCGLEEVNKYNWPGHTAEGGFYEFVRKPGQKTVLNTEFYKRGDVLQYRVKL